MQAGRASQGGIVEHATRLIRTRGHRNHIPVQHAHSPIQRAAGAPARLRGERRAALPHDALAQYRKRESEREWETRTKRRRLTGERL